MIMKINRSTHHRRVASEASFVMLLALLFTVSVAIYDINALPQAKTKSTESSGAQSKRRPSAPQLRNYGFETVTVDARGKIISRRKGQARDYVEDINGVGLDMVEIPGGVFTMGSARREEDPPHKVNVPSFYIGKDEVTQVQWRAVAKLPKVNRDLNPDPSRFKGDNLPVEEVTWEAAMECCARLHRSTGRTYRLPSEAEWEYACRAGTTTEFAFGETITPEIVNYDGNQPYGSAPKGMIRKGTTPVGSLAMANGFGLYDMVGNVEEWCLDIYHAGYERAPTDGSAWYDPSTTYVGYQTDRVARGGYWYAGAERCRSALRSYHDFMRHSGLQLGFRVVANARNNIAGSQEKLVTAPAPGAPQDDERLQHDWHIEEGTNGVNYTSNHPAPPPFSYSNEPEATVAIESVKFSGRPRPLSQVVSSEIREIRKELQIGEYLENDGHKPQRGIASWVEEIDGQQVAFIKYRFVGAKGEPRVTARTARHAILIRNRQLYFVHLTVLFARHQEEVRSDQIRLVRDIISK
jgi:formylglycine-generating enzyme required for sulfatase activity